MCKPFVSSHLCAFWQQQKSLVIIGGSGLCALFMWVVPNWNLFAQHASQLPLLWLQPENRPAILALLVKISSPIFLMSIAAFLQWLYTAFQREFREHHNQGEALQLLYLPQQSPSPEEGSFMSYEQESFLSPLPQHVLEKDDRIVFTLPTPVDSGPSDCIPVPTDEEQCALEMPEEKERVAVSCVQQVVASHSESEQDAGEKEGTQTATIPLLAISLLKDVSVVVLVPDGRRVRVPLPVHAKRLQLLAYIAWRRGTLIDRDKILEHIFGWGLDDDEATAEKLAMRFESHKKLLRKKIREIIAEYVNGPARKSLIDPQFDLFTSNGGFWGLADACTVEDIDELEKQYAIIAQARKHGKLVDDIPAYVKQACEHLIACYPGDFLETVIHKYPEEFRSWQGRGSWARKPFTLYRDYYLDALWLTAEYEWRMGQYSVKQEASDDERVQRQQEHFSRAAQMYQRYALYACNSRFDQKVTFGPHGEYGERIGMSERALRRCVVLFGAIGRTDVIHQVWSAYTAQMKKISDQRWQPEKQTIHDVESAKAQTNAYRFAAQLAQMELGFKDGPLEIEQASSL